MKLRCFGARGSIPVSGPQYVRYGGDTTCLEVRSKNGAILILDAGTGIRRLGIELLREGRTDLTMLFTHSHWDHIQGLPFFRPLYNPAVRIALGGCPRFQGDMMRILSQSLRPPLFPVPFAKAPARVEPFSWCSEKLRVDSLTITRIALSHPNLGAGYRIEEDGRSFVLLTDNELAHHHRGGRSFEDYAAFCKGADLLIHDAEYTPEEYDARRGWGHSSCLDAVRLAREAGVGLLGMFHHNQDRSDDEQDRMLLRCREALEGPGAPGCAALSQTWELEL